MRTDMDLKERIEEYCSAFESTLERDPEIFGSDLVKVHNIERLEKNGETDILSELDQFRQSLTYNIFQKRAEYLGLNISDVATLYLSTLFQTPGDIVMYLAYIAYKAYKAREISSDKQLSLDIMEIGAILGFKRLPRNEEKIHPLWDCQKIPSNIRREKGYHSDNYLDLLSQETLTHIIKEE